eukprot:6230888-Amphidinium_carterae.1
MNVCLQDTQGYIQGGAFVFEGNDQHPPLVSIWSLLWTQSLEQCAQQACNRDTLLLEHRDASPGDHALLDDLRTAAGLALPPRA